MDQRKYLSDWIAAGRAKQAVDDAYSLHYPRNEQWLAVPFQCDPQQTLFVVLAKSKTWWSVDHANWLASEIPQPDNWPRGGE